MMVLISIYAVAIVLMFGTNKDTDTNVTHIHHYNNSTSIPQVAINP